MQDNNTGGRINIDILGNKWAVKVGEIEHNDSGQMVFGFMNAEEQTLTVNEHTDTTWRLYLLLHEIIHALSYMGHLQFVKRSDFTHIDDEAKVDAIASLLADVLIRNNFIRQEVLDQLENGE